ncbi:unnamed protein product [Gemmata massiliana]|uniref:Uncharacterized protein n=1 Tax=Gemmata massiliana TaxID=1210884 RepID=A0A6P2D3M4_9BACT|nr:hypothetical protein [Gemmata massiliana]VTR94052.1 unnamed protein product [Gemmata massiliana]
MSATMTQAPGQEKKETTVKVTVKSWDSMGKKFLKPQEDVDARRVELKGRIAFFISVKQAIGRGQPTTDSEITDADGTVYVVKKGSSTGMGEYMATVEKKAIEKKP